MLQSFKRNYLQHALAVGDWLRRNGARGSIDAVSYRLSIALGECRQTFYPQFVRELGEDGGVDFIHGMGANISGFVGWMPDMGAQPKAKSWPLAQDKLHFKAFAYRQGLHVPAWTQDTAQATGPVLVKGSRSSLGRGQRGPYLLPTPGLQLSEGEYLERFIPGQLLKAWFWGPQLVVAELSPMPAVRGDGRRSLQQLIGHALGSLAPLPEAIQNLLALQGHQPQTVLPIGASALVDYRYLSPLNPAMAVDYDQLAALRGSAVEAALLDAARLALAELPSEQRAIQAFTLDGVVDDEGQLWLLEANCNPQLHPAFYDAMLNSLFETELVPVCP